MKNAIKKALTIIVLGMMSHVMIGQQEYTLNPGGSKLIIKGTSSIHDWTMEVKEPYGISFFYIENSMLKKIDKVSFSAKVKKIVSGESSLMDSKAHNALQGEKHPVITFKLLSINDIRANTNQFEGKLTGNLSIAGKTRSVELPFKGSLDRDKILVKGSLPLKMSDYGVTPPTAMLGALKTGDAIVLDYSFEFNPTSNAIKISGN